MSAIELRAICDVCNQEISDGDGSIWIGKADLRRAEQEQGSWAHWRVTHDACENGEASSAYNFAVERCRSWAELVDWTSHLMGKVWLVHTDWTQLLGAATRRSGARLVPLERPKIH